MSNASDYQSATLSEHRARRAAAANKVEKLAEALRESHPDRDYVDTVAACMTRVLRESEIAFCLKCGMLIVETLDGWMHEVPAEHAVVFGGDLRTFTSEFSNPVMVAFAEWREKDSAGYTTKGLSLWLADILGNVKPGAAQAALNGWVCTLHADTNRLEPNFPGAEEVHEAAVSAAWQQINAIHNACAKEDNRPKYKSPYTAGF